MSDFGLARLALQAARKDPPDLILLDINMPEMNGYEVCECLKADDQLKGIQGGFEYASCQVGLEPGDSILAFTDGVTEAMDINNAQLQAKGLHAAVQGGGLLLSGLG